MTQLGMRVLCLTSAALALLAGTGITAQTIPSPYRFIEARQEAGVFVGIQDMGIGRFGFGPEPGPQLGVRYGVDVSGPFGLEGLVRFSPTTRRVIDPETADLRDVGEADALMTIAEARIRFSFPGRRTWHGLSPHILFGAGVAFDLAGSQEADDRILIDDRFDFGTSFTGMFGAGVRWIPGGSFTIRADGGLDLWQLETPRGFSAPNRPFVGVEENEWVSGLSFSLGAAIRF